MLVVCLTQQTVDSVSQKCQATQVHVHFFVCQGDACGHDNSSVHSLESVIMWLSHQSGLCTSHGMGDLMKAPFQA